MAHNAVEVVTPVHVWLSFIKHIKIEVSLFQSQVYEQVLHIYKTINSSNH